MSQSKKLVIIMAISIAAAALAAYFVPVQKDTTIILITSEDKGMYEALGVAQQFIPTSPTFAFDGDINTLKTKYVGATKSLPSQHMIRATFESSHGGFGNREDQMLTQVITPHEMNIIVSEGNVISAVTDDTWDELNHQFVLKSPTEEILQDANPKQAANPASTHCFENGGTIQIRGDGESTQSICVFSDGSECEEWQYFRGECSPAKETP
jgi:putative hemolysin